MLMATNKPESSTTSYFSQQLDDLAGYSTLHGFHFVFGRHFVLRRIIWAILLITGILFSGLQLKESIGKLKSYRTIINRETEYSSELRFPAFTLCNVNMMKKSKILGTDSQYFLDLIDPLKSTAEKKEAQEKMNASFNIEQAVWENGHTISDMVSMCIWRNEQCDHRNFTTFLTEQNGLCHTFNSGQSTNPILRSNTNTKNDGLTLLINIEPHEYYGPFSYLSTGVQVMIHDQDVQPRLIRSYGIDIMPGVTTYLQLKKQKFISLPAPYKSACGTRKLQTSTKYSKEACLFECYTRLVIQNCDCRYLGMPILSEFNKTRYCSPVEIDECRKRKVLNLSKCDCPIPCKRVVYKIQHNTAYFPAPSFWPKVYTLSKINVSSISIGDQFILKQMIRQGKLMIQVSFQEPDTEVITENPAYVMCDLTADVGGILGLFLGCSILTILEFVDFLVIIILYYPITIILLLYYIILLLFGARKSTNNLKVNTEGEMQGGGRGRGRGGGALNKAVEEEQV